jgi:Protein of unknown function (DUF3108)
MLLPVLRRLALGLALAAGPLPALASEAKFDFTIAGIKVGVLVLSSEQAGNAYTATSRIETAGIVSIFADFFFDGQASGRLGDDGTVVPKLFTATSKSPRALRHTRIDWQAGTPVSVSVEPPRSSAPDPAEQGGTLDPVSATFRLFRDAPPAAICNTTVTVFDGSRLSRLKLAPPVDGDEGLTCEGIYTRVAGEAHAMAELPEFPFRMVFSHTADGLAQLERIEAPTSFGRAVIARHG